MPVLDAVALTLPVPLTGATTLLEGEMEPLALALCSSAATLLDGDTELLPAAVPRKHVQLN